MTYLLDTDTCIRYLNGRSQQVRERLESKASSEVAVCPLSRRSAPSRRHAQERGVPRPRLQGQGAVAADLLAAVAEGFLQCLYIMLPGKPFAGVEV